MIRFLPDTWRDALLRPLAMAAPDGGVYIEIMAPDFRFMFIIVLGAMLAVMLLWRQRSTATFKPATILLMGTAMAFVPWMLSTGNGRYLIPFLLAAGPLCLALVYLLPLTRGFRLAIATCLIAVQGFAVYDASPLRSWGLTEWRSPPFFQIDLPQDMSTQPGTYLTLSGISYSLIAPLFPPASHWMSVNSAPDDRDQTPAGRRTHAFLSSGNPLTLIAPSIPDYATLQGLPDAEAVRSINVILAEHRLSISDPNACRLLQSKGMAAMAGQYLENGSRKTFSLFGFWACPLSYAVDATSTSPEIAKNHFDAVFEKIETLCPRFFRRGEAKTRVINGGEMRNYGESDIKVYVLDDGAVLYKYYRAYNVQFIGTVDDVMNGKAKMDCNKIHGRAGLPWEREI